jgi:hypothetical protein
VFTVPLTLGAGGNSILEDHKVVAFAVLSNRGTSRTACGDSVASLADVLQLAEV